MDPYRRRDADKLYNELLEQVQQQIIGYQESINNKLSRIEETIQSLVQEVKGNSVGDCVEQEEFMNPIASKEGNTRSLSHLQIMFPKLEGAEVIKCPPDSEHQEFTEKPIYDEEPGEGQECWPEKEFILAALSGRNPNSSRLLQPEICTSERPEASEDLSYTQVIQDRDTHRPLPKLKPIRLEEVFLMIPTSRETFETFLSKRSVKDFLTALIPHNLSITSAKFGNGNILSFDPGGQKNNEQTKGVMACVTTEVKDLYYLLEHSFHPLDLASQVQPLLTKISKLGAKLSSVSSVPEGQLSQYIPSLEKLTTLRLLQQISQESDDNNRFEGFWLLKNSPGPVVEHGFCEKESTTPLMSQLKSNGMVPWGIRRQVKILNSHRDNSTGHPQSSTSFVRRSEEKLQSDEDNVAEKHEQEGEEEEDNDDYEEDEEEEEIENELYEETVKRKKYSLEKNARKAKEVKRSKQKQVYKKKTRNKCKKMIDGHSINRWSAEMYKLAERNLLEVMKAKGAVFNSPILRPELILEARKRIGDTGLLDHLLKQLSGKLAPGGAERFRKRHNADGAMEYWLESADLVRVRKEAGVQDPYWTPPAGWIPGDCPSQDPTCAKEIRLHKEEKAKIKRDMENMLSKKQLKEELQNLRREINVQFSKMQEEILALKVQSSGAISQNLNVEASLMAPWKSDFDSALVQVNKQTKQLAEISDSLIRMKDEIGKLNSMEGLASKTGRFDKIIREINQQYVHSVKTWMIVLPYKYKSRCIDLRQGSPGKVMRFEIHDAWRRKYTITIFDPGGRKWSHEINHEDMVVFQGGRIVRTIPCKMGKRIAVTSISNKAAIQ